MALPEVTAQSVLLSERRDFNRISGKFPRGTVIVTADNWAPLATGFAGKGGTAMEKTKNRLGRAPTGERGSSVVEALTVLVIAGILTTAAIPQLISARRLIRSAALPREIVAQLRYARQQAMSQRQAFTFQYDDTNKQISIIDHNNTNNATSACNVTGAAIVADASYPNTACSRTVMTIQLTGRIVLPASELSFGIPSGVTVSTLGDNTTPTALSGGKLNVAFQPDGSVIDTSGNYSNRTLFFYNNKAPRETAAAISVLGVSGRIKVWRLESATNTYVE